MEKEVSKEERFGMNHKAVLTVLAGVRSAVKAANPPYYSCVNLRMNLFCFMQSEVLVSTALWSLTIITHLTTMFGKAFPSARVQDVRPGVTLKYAAE